MKRTVAFIASAIRLGLIQPDNAGAGERMSLERAIEVVTTPAYGFGERPPGLETQVVCRMENVLLGRDFTGPQYQFDPADAPRWRALMRDPSASYYGRLCAADFLSTTDEEARQFVIAELRSDNLRHRYNAGEILRFHFDQDFKWNMMISLLADGSLDVRDENRKQYNEERFGRFPEGDYEDILHSPVDQYCYELGHSKVARAVDALMSVVERGAHGTSAASSASSALAEIGDPKAVPVLLKYLRSSRSGRAATALGKFNCREAAPFIAETLLTHQTTTEEKRVFLRALRDIGDASVVPVLEQFVASEKDAACKANAIRVLVQLTEKDPVARLLEFLSFETYEPERADIIRDLSRYPDNRVIHHLDEIARTSDSVFMRRSAIHGVGNSGSQKGLLALADLLKTEFPNTLKAEWGWKWRPDDFNKELHRHIHDLLVETTKQDFGEDAEKWIKWIKDNPAVFNKGPAK